MRSQQQQQQQHYHYQGRRHYNMMGLKSSSFSSLTFVFRVFILMMVFSSSHMVVHAQKGTERSFIIVNNSGSRIELYWVHPQTDERLLMSKPDILFGAEQNMDSFMTHKFEVRELPKKSTGICAIGAAAAAAATEEGSDETPPKCMSSYFAVNENSNQIITVQRDFTLIHSDDKTVAHDRATDLVKECKEKLLVGQTEDNGNKDALLQEVATCIQTGFSDALQQGNEEVNFSANIRQRLGTQLEVYACADDTLNTTEEIKQITMTVPTTTSEKSWTQRTQKSQQYKVKIMSNKPTSATIHVIDNFISPEECQDFEKHSTTDMNNDAQDYGDDDNLQHLLHATQLTTVASPSDSPMVSALQQRIMDYTSHVLKIDTTTTTTTTTLRNENPFMMDANVGDDYPPHVDYHTKHDQQNESTTITNKRVATMLLYCETPKKGGAIHFRNTGIHIQPQSNNYVGTAVFVTYVDPVEDTHDATSKFTEYSICPVVEGTQKVMIQYVTLD